MKESGMQGKDFMQQLINLYVIEQAKESIPEVAEDLKELQGLTQRINDIYLNIGCRIDNLIKSKNNEMIKEVSKKDKIIKNLQEKIEDKNNQYDNLMDIYSGMVNNEHELKDEVNQLIGNLDNIKALNDEYRDKIGTLTGIIDEYKGYKIKNDQLKTEINKLTEKIDELYSEINAKNTSIKELDIAVKNLKEDITNLNVQHEKEIANIKKELELEKEKTILESEKGYQNTINNLQESYNRKVREYQDKLDTLQINYNSRLEEYQNKYLNLLGKN